MPCFGRSVSRMASTLQKFTSRLPTCWMGSTKPNPCAGGDSVMVRSAHPAKDSIRDCSCAHMLMCSQNARSRMCPGSAISHSLATWQSTISVWPHRGEPETAHKLPHAVLEVHAPPTATQQGCVACRDTNL